MAKTRFALSCVCRCILRFSKVATAIPPAAPDGGEFRRNIADLPQGDQTGPSDAS
jgi:hypothetical protein